MGPSLFPIIADIVMQHLESKVINGIGYELTFYVCYVDDIALAAPIKITHILNTFNSHHNHLKFTVEHENNRTLNFLDLTLKIENNTVTIDWFHKNTFSGRYLLYLSHHPLNHKIRTIYSLIDRAILLSHLNFHLKKHRILH